MKPKYVPSNKTLTTEQRNAFLKLQEGINAIVALDASDAETIQSWLSSSYAGPCGQPRIVYEAAHAVFSTIQDHDERGTYEDDSAWSRLLEVVLR